MTEGCPGCGGPTEYDREVPPNPYYCEKCEYEYAYQCVVSSNPRVSGDGKQPKEEKPPNSRKRKMTREYINDFDEVCLSGSNSTTDRRPATELELEQQSRIAELEAERDRLTDAIDAFNHIDRSGRHDTADLEQLNDAIERCLSLIES